MAPVEAFARIVAVPDTEIDLARAACLIAASRYPDLDVDVQLRLLDSLAAACRPLLADDHDPLYSCNVLSQYLFDEVGFHGNGDDYYDPRNSYLNEVLGRRLGIPITLSLVYVEVGRRLDIPLVGVGMPGHFLVRHQHVEDLFIDPFFGGILLSESECAERVEQITGIQLRREHLAPITKRAFLTRMIRNLQGIYRQQKNAYALADIEQLLGCLENVP